MDHHFFLFALLLISVTFAIYLLGLGTETLIPIFKTYITIPAIVFVPFVIFVMLGTTNAINLTDGIDGLATSVTTIIIACLTVIGITNGVKEVVALGSIVCGVNLGFLLFNMHPAKVFMGDTGSLALGGALAAIAILTKHELSLAIVGGVFVVETLSSLIQMIAIIKFNKKIFRMAPLHHHYEQVGWKEQDIVKVFYVIGLILAMIAIAYGVWI